MYLFYVIYAIFISYIILYLYNMYCYTFFFSLWRTSFCMTDSRFVHIYTNDPISDLFMVEYYSTAYMYHIFIHPSANGHLSCFYALLIVLMNSAAMNIEMHVSSWIMVFLEYMMSVEQGTGQKLGKEYIKAVYFHPAYLTYAEYIMWNASCMKHKLESRSPGEISITSDGITLMAESEEELKSFLMKVKEESEKAILKLSIQKLRSWHHSHHFM